MLPEQSMGNISAFWIQVIENHIRIARMASSEYDYFKIFR